MANKKRPISPIMTKGFTLVELCIVVGVIAIIIAIAIPSLGTSKAETEDKKRKATITSIEMAKTRYVLASPSNLMGVETQLGHIASYMKTDGKVPTSLLDLVKGTGRTESDLDLGTYQDELAHFGNTSSLTTNPPSYPPALTVPSFTNITANNATFTWGVDTNAAGYQWQWGSGTNWGETPSSYNYHLPPGGFSFAGLTPSTTYYARVRWTNGTNTGGWATNTFTTLP